MWLAYIPLLTYKHAEGKEGTEVIPGLAEALPEVTNGGKTYELTLRKGIKYSNGKPVEASDFKYAVERMFKLDSPGSGFYTDIAGAEKFQETKKGGITGIEADDKTREITIDLTKPRGTFPAELALMFVAPVPSDTPADDQTKEPIPATGS
jgi:peptide/nickel transport system substrate-binding protein